MSDIQWFSADFQPYSGDKELHTRLLKVYGVERISQQGQKLVIQVNARTKAVAYEIQSVFDDYQHLEDPEITAEEPPVPGFYLS